MDYTNKGFLEIPSPSNFELQNNIKDLRDLNLNFNSSDESFSSNSTKNYSGKKNDVLNSFDLLCDSASKSSDQSLEEMDISRKAKNHKSFVSIIKFLRNSMKNKATRDQPQNIFRRPTEYIRVRGISGLPIKVIKESSVSSSCYQHVVKR